MSLDENHVIEILRHLDFFRSWGGGSLVFSKSVTYRPILSKFRGDVAPRNKLLTLLTLLSMLAMLTITDFLAKQDGVDSIPFCIF